MPRQLRGARAVLVRFVLWNLADSQTNVGELRRYLQDEAEASEQELPSRARALIGKDPDVVEVFDLEASVSIAADLARLGLAFQ